MGMRREGASKNTPGHLCPCRGPPSHGWSFPAQQPIETPGHPSSMRLLTSLPRSVTRPLSLLILAAWVGSMGLLVSRAYLQASPGKLATDLARYGPTAVWRGIYYRGEKVGFTVSQTVRTDAGFEIQEDG